MPSLQKRLRGQFLLLGVVPVVAVFVAAWGLLMPALLQQAEARNSELALAVRDQVGLQLALRLRAAEQLSDRLRSDPPPPGALRRALQSLIERDRYLQAAYVTDARGQVVDAALPVGSGRFVDDVVGLDLSGQTHFTDARRSRAPVWSDTFLSTLTGQATVALALPAGEQTILLELSLAALSGLLVDIAQPGASQVTIVDRAGRVIADPDARRALQQETLSGLPLVRTVLGGTAGSARTEHDGGQQLAHAVPVTPIGWAVLVSQPVSVVMSPLLRLGGAVLAVLGVTVLVAAGVGWRMARRTGREVTLLADGAQRAVSDGGIPQELSFSTREFHAVWTRLRDLFQQLHERDTLTRAARQDLQAVLDAATQVAIFAMDRQGVVTVFNIGAQRMLGWRSDEVLGRLTPAAWHDEAELAARAQALSRRHGQPVEGVEALLAESRHSGYEVRDWVCVRRDGARLDVSLAVTAMHTPDGSLKGFLGVAIDITERRRAAALELARRSAEFANQAKSDFLSKMSHELRTPLNAILGFAQLIEAEQARRLPTPQDEHVRHIQRAGWHLVRLIDDVLDLARIESGRMALTIVPVELGPLVMQVGQMVQAQMRQHGVTLRLQLPDGHAGSPGAGLRVAADETRLSQVLVNLLGNAAKYNRPGGEVALECLRDGPVVRLRVSDTGIGMSAQQLAHLYEPFNRLGQEGGTQEGTGIGLVITRHLVEMMHGTIEVHSEPGVGTRFEVTLPLAAEAVPAAADEQPAGDPALPRASAGRVVYIEDNEVNALLLRAALRQRPLVELQVCDRAEAGLQAIRAAPPDLILLDMHLPDASGEQVLARLQADPRLACVPVVVVSADATQARIDEMLRQGARAYLTKPLELSGVLEVIDRLLDAEAAGERALPR